MIHELPHAVPAPEHNITHIRIRDVNAGRSGEIITSTEALYEADGEYHTHPYIDRLSGHIQAWQRSDFNAFCASRGKPAGAMNTRYDIGDIVAWHDRVPTYWGRKLTPPLGSETDTAVGGIE